MDLNSIPPEQTDNFPIGVTEEEFNTNEEVIAFLFGLDYAENLDVSYGSFFRRNGKYVIRVRIGVWDNADD